MHVWHSIADGCMRHRFLVSADCHPQTIAVVQTRAKPLGIEIVVGNHRSIDWTSAFFGVLIQYPDTNGTIHDYRSLVADAHSHGALVVAAADLLSLTLLTPPGDFGADVYVGSSHGFAGPMGLGGPRP